MNILAGLLWICFALAVWALIKEVPAVAEELNDTTAEILKLDEMLRDELN